jgi:type IV secretory pathway VirB2 component (pilin)
MRVQKIVSILLIAYIFAMQFVSAQFNQTLSEEDKRTFDTILEPVLRIYNLIKYAATFVAVIMLVIAGVSYITSGSDPGKRESSKNTIMYVFIGLAIIWAAPWFVQFMI